MILQWEKFCRKWIFEECEYAKIQKWKLLDLAVVYLNYLETQKLIKTYL